MAKDTKDTPENESISLAKEITRYLARVEGLLVTLYSSMAATQDSREKAKDKRIELLEKYGEKSETDGEITYQVPAKNVLEVDKAEKRLDYFEIGVDTLPKSHIIALVSAYDYFLGRIVRWYFLQIPQALEGTDKSLTLSELLKFDSVDDAKEYFLEREVEGLLRKSHSKQFDWLESKLGCTLRKGLEIWPEFIEITERRNLFAHTDGVVSRQYLSVCKANDFVFEEEPGPGDVIWVPPEYFNRAATVMSWLGVMLAQTIWRITKPDEIKEADESLNNLCFELMRMERFKTAIRLLDFANDLPKYSDEQLRRMFVINRAQCYKWLDDNDKCLEILSKEDWSATGRDFRICVAVLEDRFADASDLMKSLGQEGAIKEVDYISWPMFRMFRESNEFIESFRHVFGKDPVEELGSNLTEGNENEDVDTKETLGDEDD